MAEVGRWICIVKCFLVAKLRGLLGYEDMLNVSKGIDLKRVKKKLKVADPVKKMDGGGM